MKPLDAFLEFFANLITTKHPNESLSEFNARLRRREEQLPVALVAGLSAGLLVALVFTALAALLQ